MPKKPARKPSKPAARRPLKARPNGRVLTVKHLDKASYEAIHTLPRGQRGEVLKLLLKRYAGFRTRNPESAPTAFVVVDEIVTAPVAALADAAANA